MIHCVASTRKPRFATVARSSFSLGTYPPFGPLRVIIRLCGKKLFIVQYPMNYTHAGPWSWGVMILEVTPTQCMVLTYRHSPCASYTTCTRNNDDTDMWRHGPDTAYLPQTF